MFGAMIGDIVGSIYEFDNIKTKEFPLFGAGCKFTDDTVMTLAVAEALMNGGGADNYVSAMKRLGQKYWQSGFGHRFFIWLGKQDSSHPYNSFGNGSAMRVSPVGWWWQTLEDTEKEAEVSAAVTHNHPEGIKGAQATAGAIFLARNGATKEDIKRYVTEKYGYDLSRTLDEIRPGYEFNETCQETVPEAVTAFLESADFEDAIRCAVSLGGDTDTLAAITGSIAEAAYGIPEQIAATAAKYLDEPLLEITRRWYKALAERGMTLPVFL